MQGELNPSQNRGDAKRVPLALAAAIALAALANARLWAADPASAVRLNHPQITGATTNATLANGWYGPGYDGGTGYFNPAVTGEYNPYPYYNIVGGESYAPLYEIGLPNQNESPFNPQAALTRHGSAAPGLMQHQASLAVGKKAEPVVPIDSVQGAH